MKVTNYRIPPEEIGKIQQNCRNLRQISIHDVEREGRTAISHLLASYSDQLEFADIYCMNEVQWNRVIRVCTKARFSVIGVISYSLFPSINIPGRQLEKIRVVPNTFVGDVNEITNAWSKCVNLHELHVDLDNVEHVRAILSTPKVLLKKIRILFDAQMDGTEMKQLMEILSNGTTGVEEFSLTCPSYRVV